MYQDKKNEIGSAIDEFNRNESGATAIEYSLIGAAVGLTLVAVMPAFNQATMETYTQILSYFGTR